MQLFLSKGVPWHPAPYTLHPNPKTQNPTPCTLHPTPYTQHPKPKTQNPNQARTFPAPGELGGRHIRETHVPEVTSLSLSLSLSHTHSLSLSLDRALSLFVSHAVSKRILRPTGVRGPHQGPSYTNPAPPTERRVVVRGPRSRERESGLLNTLHASRCTLHHTPSTLAPATTSDYLPCFKNGDSPCRVKSGTIPCRANHQFSKQDK